MPDFENEDFLIERLHGLLLAFDSRDKAIRPGLERIRALCAVLDQPQTRFPAIHVAGTNGKGSVVTFIAEALKANGLSVGVYTSPHLRRWSERIAINNTEIAVSDFIQTIEALFDAAKAVGATVFELVTAVSFDHFARRRVDVAVVEVGLGGRFDATNLVDPVLTALTGVDVDHTNYLGHDLQKIAWEKAGIAKPGVPMVSAALSPELRPVVQAECDAVGAPLCWAEPLRVIASTLNEQTFESHWGELSVKALGVYQAQNLATALRALDALSPRFALNRTKSVQGLTRALWPARFEVFRQAPLWILDGCHNPSGAKALRQTLEAVVAPAHRNGKRWLLFGMRADKDYVQTAQILFPWFDRIALSALPGTAGLDPSALCEYAQRQDPGAGVFNHPCDAVDHLNRHAAKGDVVCVAGSLVLVGEVRWRLLTGLF